MQYAARFQLKGSHHASLERLEARIALAGDTTCELEPTDLPQSEATRAAYAVNCFALDLYEHYRPEEGNLFLSPLSISTALTMAYAGAAGQTAAEMEEVLHLGTEPGIHESFSALLRSLTSHPTYDLHLANAQWPKAGFPIHPEFVDHIETQYDGYTQSLNYGRDVEEARQIINQWVEDHTNGRIEELIRSLDPRTVMVLTNAIFFRAFWSTPFAPMNTFERSFTLDDGSTVTVPMMRQPSYPQVMEARDGGFTTNRSPGYGYSEHGDFRILEMPYEGKQTSMVLLLPKEGSSTDDLTPKTLADVERWLNSAPERKHNINLSLPRFKTTVSSKLEELLRDMGMPSAFGNADFSRMTDAHVWIDQVGHKAFLEINEQGTEAAAATFVSFIVCFAEGTPVVTSDGEKPIEEISAGDYVVSRDENNIEGKVEPMQVEETFQNRAELLELHIERKKIRTTAKHPFFVKGRGWTKAGELQPGDLLAIDQGLWLPLQAIDQVEGTHEVYNFRVAGHHTYFVGGREFGFAVWTHNSCAGEEIEYTVDRPFHFFIRDNSTSAMLFLGRISDPTAEAENALTPHFVAPDEADDDSTPEVPLAADANGDGEVDFADFLVLSQNYGKASDVVFAEGDFDENGVINFTDFLILSASFTAASEPIALH